MAERLTTKIDALSGWNNAVDYVVIVERDDEAEFEMSLDDTRSNTLARAFTNQVAWCRPAAGASNGYQVNVSADPRRR